MPENERCLKNILFCYLYLTQNHTARGVVAEAKPDLLQKFTKMKNSKLESWRKKLVRRLDFNR